MEYDAFKPAFLEDARTPLCSVCARQLRAPQALAQGFCSAEGALSDGSDSGWKGHSSNTVGISKNITHIPAELYAGRAYAW